MSFSIGSFCLVGRNLGGVFTLRSVDHLLNIFLFASTVAHFSCGRVWRLCRCPLPLSFALGCAISYALSPQERLCWNSEDIENAAIELGAEAKIDRWRFFGRQRVHLEHIGRKRHKVGLEFPCFAVYFFLLLGCRLAKRARSFGRSSCSSVSEARLQGLGDSRGWLYRGIVEKLRGLPL